MSFRDHMRVNRSGSEDTIQVALSSAGLTRGCVTGWGFEFTCEESAEFGVMGTWADRYWPHAKLVVFFDGQPHLKQHQLARDEAVTACLEARGLTVKRYPYHAPITKKRLAEIVCDLAKILRPS
jgi:hypothetical protein